MGAKRDSDGHFHCTAPLAICPIHAFSAHMNTEQSACVCVCASPQLSVHENAATTNRSRRGGDTAMTRLVVLFAVIRHQGWNCVCANEDNADVFSSLGRAGSGARGPPARLGKSFNWTGVLTESLRKKLHVRFREKGVRSLASSRAEPLA